MMDVRRNFVPPNVQQIEEREAMQKGDILFTDFLLKWLRVAKSTVCSKSESSPLRVS